MANLIVKSVLSGMTLMAPFASYALDQWANNVINFSTQYSTTNWSAKQTLKAPNTFTYGDINTAWTTSTPDASAEYISVGFLTPVYASGATIRETFGYGFVVGIDAIDSAGVTHTVWSGVDNSVPNQINDFSVTWPMTSYLVTGLKVRTNNALHSGYEEIDAIQLRGIESLSGTIAPRIGHAATLVCTNATTSQTITTTIKGPGQNGPVTKWDCQQAGLVFSTGDTVSIQITGKIAP